MRVAAFPVALLAVAAIGCGSPQQGTSRAQGPRAPAAVIRCFKQSPAVDAVSDATDAKERFGFERHIAGKRAAIAVTLRSREPAEVMHDGGQRLELLFTRDTRSAKRLRDRLIEVVAGYGGGIPPGYDGTPYPLTPTLIKAEGPVVEAFLGLDPGAAQQRLASRCVRGALARRRGDGRDGRARRSH